jgi:hypothetical protein
MAQRVQIILEDDYDGGVADSTVKFSLGSDEYEIDLSEENASKMADALAPWVAHARRLGRGKRRSVAASKPAGSSNTSDIRAWAQENGREVSSRGRVSAEIREAYEKANS